MNSPSWLEISLTVKKELAEAVAEVLARYTTNGVVIEATALDQISDLPTQLPDNVRVYGYLPYDEHLPATRQSVEEALWHLGMIRPLPEPTYKDLLETDWVEAWKQHYHPIAVGKKLLIVPEWLESRAGDRLTIRIKPAMAFGTGTHPTTQLSLELIEEHLTPGQALIDLGCGSGILSLAAFQLGARPVLGVDKSPEAVASARENAALNGAPEFLTFSIGSVQEILEGNFPIQKAPVVVANILAPILIKLLDQGLDDLLTPQGCLILSGILNTQERDLRAALETHHLEVISCRREGDWIAIASHRQSG